MPTSLELANRILQTERRLQTLYNQLDSSITEPRRKRSVQSLRDLQSRQISILNSLVEELEREQPPVPEERYYAQHIVQPWETLRIIALEYETTVPELRRLNPGISMNPAPGTLVNLPIEIPKPPRNSFRYIVRENDTLFRIAQRFGTDVETLVRLNSISDPDIIFPGRVLIVPNGS